MPIKKTTKDNSKKISEEKVKNQIEELDLNNIKIDLADYN